MSFGDIDADIKAKIIGILHTLFPGAKIYLYGSRARGTNREYSDIDLAIDTGKPQINIGEARAIFEASHIPYKIDIVDLQSASPKLREMILKDGKIWNR